MNKAHIHRNTHTYRKSYLPPIEVVKISKVTGLIVKSLYTARLHFLFSTVIAIHSEHEPFRRIRHNPFIDKKLHN